jgi:hypothetical protein
VLLDTFVVRPILLPAFLVLLESGRFRSPRKFLRLEHIAPQPSAAEPTALQLAGRTHTP